MIHSATKLRPARQRYRHEALLLLLVGAAALSFVYKLNWQDTSRLSLTQSFALDRSLRIDRWAEQTGDKARYGGHFYTDKAPGLSLLALPSFAALRAGGAIGSREERLGAWNRASTLWILRLASAGLLFLLAVLLVGRGAERIAVGAGGPVAATFGLGTLAAPLAAISFGHVGAAAFGFAAFLLAWGVARDPGPRLARAAASGFCAGVAVLLEYEAAVVAGLVVLYLAWASRRLGVALAYAAGLVPACAGLAVYDRAAFGSPLHLSYRYVTGFAEAQHRGFFGIGLPDVHGLAKSLAVPHGLLLGSPVLILAALGLVELWRRGLRDEAALCAAVSLAFVFLDAGYFDPYGGTSPGPRFVVPALPFLALGLAPAYERWPRATGFAAVVSIGVTLSECATWAAPLGDRWTSVTVWSYWLGAPRAVGLAIVSTLALGAVLLARPQLLTRRHWRGAGRDDRGSAPADRV